MPNHPLLRTLPFMALLLGACAPMVPSSPAQLLPQASVSADQLGGDLRLSSAIPLKLPTGFGRVLPADSRWRAIGRLPQGMMYRPVGTVFSIEGRQIHEAYLVVDADRALTSK